MFQVKPIAKEAAAAALERAMRYRLLNEPHDAESICLDVLEVEPENQEALVTLLLALTDQFDERLGSAVKVAQALLPRLRDDYSQVYYEGVICERKAKAHLKLGRHHFGHMAYDWLRRAMECYERAETSCPPDNHEAILRWNSCARILNQRSDLVPWPEEEPSEHMLE